MPEDSEHTLIPGEIKFDIEDNGDDDNDSDFYDELDPNDNEKEKKPNNPEHKDVFNKYEQRITNILTKAISLTAEFAEKYQDQTEFIYDAATTTATIILRIAATQDLHKYKPEGFKLEKNSPVNYLTALKKGVELFEKQQLTKKEEDRFQVFWEPNENAPKLAELIKIFNEPLLAYRLEELNDYLHDKGLKKVEEITLKNAILLGLKHKIKEIADITKSVLSDNLPGSSSAISNAKSGDPDSELYKFNIHSTRNFAEKTIKDINTENSQVGVSDILAKALEETKGNLQAALFLTTDFFYSASRRSYLSVFDNEDDHTTWFKTHIKDEYSFMLPFSSFEGAEVYTRAQPPVKITEERRDPMIINYDYSLENQIGKAYHASNLVALLYHFPPEFIAVMAVGEYLQFGDKHGLAKIWSDFRILKQLPRIQGWLRSYQKPATQKE